MDTATHSMTPKSDSDLTNYQRTNKPEQQSNTFGFWHLKILAKLKMIAHYKHEASRKELKVKEKLNPKRWYGIRITTLDWFDSTDTLLTEFEKQALEDIIVEYHDLFARQKVHIGMNTEFKVKLTPCFIAKGYQCQSTWKKIKMINWPWCTSMESSRSCLFSSTQVPSLQRKPKGKLRLLVDLRKTNNLIADDYINNNQPVSTLADAAQHLAVKSFFFRFVYSQEYQCFQTADQRSVEKLAFNFDSKSDWLQKIGKKSQQICVFFFSYFVREFLDPVVNVVQCAQDLDDIRIAANNDRAPSRHKRAFFQCIRKTGLKLTIKNWHFVVRQVEFLGKPYN